MIREIVIVSGKGGTGKTSLAAAFAALAKNGILCDADVDAADLHLLMQPEVKKRTDFMGGSKAVINPDLCTGCGTCRTLCRFDAISDRYEVDPIRCEGCGVCVDFCPEQAIDFPVQRCGEWYISATRFGPMVHARLGIAEENSGRLVSLVRKETRQLAEERGLELILTDGPPGIGCPVIAAIGGATALVIVVEPTVSGIHDMERVVDLAAHFRVPGMVIVNKYDLNVEMTETIEQLAVQRNLVVLGRVPFDPVFTRSMVQGQTLFEYGEETPTRQVVRDIWAKIISSPSMNPLGSWISKQPFNDDGEGFMVRVAIPSEGNGGLDGRRAGHFGHCDVFTCIDVEDGQIQAVHILPNQEHVQGGCMVPVNLLAQAGVNALVVGGIGMRPLMGFRQVGIEVYHDGERPEIRPVVEDFLAGRLPRISDDQVCGGGGH